MLQPRHILVQERIRNSIIYCQIQQKQMKKVKSTSKVGRNSFFQRIKKDTQEPSMKENVNINQIKESAYKLSRSKSHRKDHSLERKIPIFSTQGNHPSGKITKASKIQTFFHSEQEASHQELGKSFRELFGMLQVSKKRVAVSEHFESDYEAIGLEQEKEVIELVKVMWSTVVKMKSHLCFKEETTEIEGILKTIVLKLAKPKLQFLEEHSSLSFKVPPFKYSSPDNIISLRGESKPQSREKQERNAIDGRRSQEVPAEELELKKIMYILEQSHKLSMKEDPSLSEVVEKNEPKSNQLLASNKEGSTFSLKRNKSSLSSFVDSQSNRTGVLLYQQEKAAQSLSSDRLFLRSIVKKAKSNRSDKQNTLTKLKTEVCCETASNGHTFSNVSISEENSFKATKSIHSSDQYLFSILSDSVSIVEADHFSNAPSVHNSPLAFESLQQPSYRQGMPVEIEGESKRATLNSIISMLNSKYNKNIKFQPRKGM